MQKKLLTKFNTIYDKNSPESRHRGNLPQHNKGHIWQTHSQHRSQWWKTETISSKIRNKTKMPTLTAIIQLSFGSFSHSNQRRKRNKRNPNQKRRSKAVTVCRWHDTLHRESQRSTHSKHSHKLYPFQLIWVTKFQKSICKVILSILSFLHTFVWIIHLLNHSNKSGRVIFFSSTFLWSLFHLLP